MYAHEVHNLWDSTTKASKTGERGVSVSRTALQFSKAIAGPKATCAAGAPSSIDQILKLTKKPEPL